MWRGILDFLKHVGMLRIFFVLENYLHTASDSDVVELGNHLIGVVL